jgi:catecholate siderophore receptor
MGVVAGSITIGTRPLAAAAVVPPPDRRITIGREELDRAIAHSRVWTPAETVLPSLLQDPPGAPPARVQKVDIPPGTLGTVLEAFGKLTGFTVTVAEEGIKAIASPGAAAVDAPEQALRALLAGTGVSFRFTAPTHVVLEVRRHAEQVDVTGAPRMQSPTFTEPLRDTPQTVTVIPRDVIQAQAATTLRDVLRNVPGITYQAGEGGGGLPGDTLTMRGFSATNDIFVDGLRDAGAYSRDAFNLEQVEVVKGPSSAQAGRGATGGTINLATKTPFAQRAVAGTMGGGSADYVRGTLDLNEPLGEALGGSAVRLNAMWTDARVPGRDLVENQSWAVAPSFAAGLSRRTRLLVTSQHFRQDNVPDYGLPWAAFEAAPPVDQSNFYGLRDYDYEDIDNDVVSVHVDSALRPAVSLRNLSRYGRTRRDSAITAPRPPNRQLQQRTMTSSILANQTTLNARVRTGKFEHALVAGVEVAREDTNNRNRAQAANQPQTDLYSPDPDERPLGPLPPNTGNPSSARTTTAGVYAFDTVHVGDHLLLSGGLRWDRSEVDYELIDLANGAATRLGRTDGMLSWRAGAVVKPKAEVSLYVGAGTSFNPSADAATTGTALSENPTAANNVNLDPEKSRSVEAGAKWDLLGARLSVAAAVFRTEKTNARTRNLTNEPFVLSGRHRVAGVELSASGRITPRWSVLAGYAWMDSEIVATANPAEQANDLALVPKGSLSIWTTYDLPWRVSIGGGTQFVDNVFRNTLNTLTVPGYWLVNATAAYEVNSHLTLRLNANNLADEIYVDRVGGGHYIPGPRRSVVLSAGLTF